MRIIISPAKKMNRNRDLLEYKDFPHFIKEAESLLSYLRQLSYDEMKGVWNCNDNLAALNYERVKKMDLYKNLSPAILSYEGIQYQYLAPAVFNNQEYQYLEKHLRILSGFYGMLKPFDGVTPYRLEMQARLKSAEFGSLYEFWNGKLAEQLSKETNCIVNLASKEYSKGISGWLSKDIRFLTCVFGEMIHNKVIEKGTQVKMARGEMVRYMAEHQIEEIEKIKNFNRLNYTFSESLSDETTYTFVKREKLQVGDEYESPD
ncbi:peroxide stress protein YaaA [Anaerocolumna sp. AGMB13025]|uniref:peroxide stress protein YaaA n=1 Tax=Anaerocolumna sp. AGMB13025 TaxID=3039116 RepID=UPI00241FC644|nr:peroxide stress protein YaaA [Anaerocolumna sp. AGMB13025]WFR59105.1 peroxide stress protein YaaA [Anaerocolumna sp. AGMB13025]